MLWLAGRLCENMCPVPEHPFLSSRAENTMRITVRTAQLDEYSTLEQQLMRGFGGDSHDGEVERRRALLPPERTSCAFDGEHMIGTCGGYGLELALPGGNTLPMCGTTIVTVAQTHRRRGVLRQMMRHHLDQALERDDPLAGLWASEGSIYPRFGFGPAAECLLARIDSRAVNIDGVDPALKLRSVELADVESAIGAFYESIWRERAGHFARGREWWRMRFCTDPEHYRDGGSEMRCVVCERDGNVEGYVRYRQFMTEAEFGQGVIRGAELMAPGAAAHAALWNFLLNIDLFPKIEFWNLPVDDELEWRVADLYKVRRTIIDNLWLRILDVPRALSARAYNVDEKIRIQVHDEFGEHACGCFELETSPAGSQCTTTSADADVELPAWALGALYLGRRCALPMTKAGIIKGSEADVLKLDRMFLWDRDPWCSELF